MTEGFTFAVGNAERLAEACKEMTYQEPFAMVVKCRGCQKPAHIILVVNDGQKLVADARPEGVQIWPHDSVAVAVYLCTDGCGEMTAEWNQG